jgi:hypothetical protein
MDQLAFSYDQIIEHLCRLYCFVSVGSDNIPYELDVEDIETMFDLLARRDLPLFAATIRNFAEMTSSLSQMKEAKVKLSEIYISAGLPFFRHTKSSISLYSCVSRILHSHHVRLFRTTAN